jgi:hypothetical protein
MFDQYQGLSGPDFLEAIADVELGNGNEVNADIYRQRARSWRQDQADLEAAQTRIASQQRALDAARRTPTATRTTGAITPSARTP